MSRSRPFCSAAGTCGSLQARGRCATYTSRPSSAPDSVGVLALRRIVMVHGRRSTTPWRATPILRSCRQTSGTVGMRIMAHNQHVHMADGRAVRGSSSQCSTREKRVKPHHQQAKLACSRDRRPDASVAEAFKSEASRRHSSNARLALLPHSL